MKKGGFSLLGIVALFLSLITTVQRNFLRHDLN